MRLCYFAFYRSHAGVGTVDGGQALPDSQAEPDLHELL